MLGFLAKELPEYYMLLIELKVCARNGTQGLEHIYLPKLKKKNILVTCVKDINQVRT